jgi:hypothetical protein
MKTPLNCQPDRLGRVIVAVLFGNVQSAMAKRIDYISSRANALPAGDFSSAFDKVPSWSVSQTVM